MHTLLLAFIVAMAQTPGQASPSPDSLPGQGTATSPVADGQWSVVYAELDGKKMADAQGQAVTLRGNSLTYTLDGKHQTVRLNFGPNNTLTAMKMESSKPGEKNTPPSSDRANSQPGGSDPAGRGERGQAGSGTADRDNVGSDLHQGVYISTDDFFCICLYTGIGDQKIQRTGATGGVNETPRRSAAGGQGAGNATGGVDDPTRSGNGSTQTAGAVMRQGKIVLILRKGSGSETGSPRR